MKKKRLMFGLAALAMVPVFALTACSSAGGRDTGTAEDPAVAGVADTPSIKIAMITHAPPGDTFWDTVRKGAETAAAKDNVELLYSGDPESANQAQLIQQAVDQGVDGIAVTLAKGDALEDALKNAEEAGIPVVGFNGGLEEAFEFGAFTFIGQDETVAGRALGDRIAEDGYAKPLCVIQMQGHVGLEARCAGIKEKVPGTEILYVTGTDMTQVKSTITAKLQSTPDADIVVGLGAPFTLTAVDAVAETGSKAKVASFDLNADLAQAVIDGTVQFTVDQQPYLQGYLAVDSLWLYNNGGFEIGGGQPVYTGPTIIDSENAEAVLEQAEKGIR